MALSPSEIADLRTDLLEFTRYMFQRRKGAEFKVAPHHVTVCHALERVVIGQSKRLIINIPPRSGKTELAVKNFLAWCMGNFPDCEFIHASYSKRLATTNTWEARAIMQHEAFADVFGAPAFRDDSNAKDEFRTEQGGIVYATGSEGTITGYGAGKMRDTFGGCFPSWQEVETAHGPKAISDLVSDSGDVKVWAYDEENQRRSLHKVTRFWRNPENDIIRVVMSDGSHFDCTPDHEILTESGWVAAIHLSNALDLVKAKASDAGRLRSGDGPVIGNIDDAFRVLWLLVPLRVRQTIRDDFPRLAHFDLADHASANPISGCDKASAFAALEYLNDIFSGQLGTGPAFQNWESPMAQSVLHVVGLCAIREIAKPVVDGNSVQMANLIPIGAFTYKLLCDQMRNVFGCHNPANGKADAHVAFPVARGLKKSDGLCPSDLSKVRNLVKPARSGDVFPVGVFYVGHVSETFCLEVGGVYNFELSHSGAIVSNCIIIDDPHKAGEGNSDTMRQNVIDWFSTTMESRKNSPDTPIVLIMQRLHEMDLAGWLLSGGNGEKWDHVNIPARDATGGSFWPDQFPPDMLDRLERSNSYVFAGQYMQRPAPVGGGILKDEWWQYYTALPALEYRTIYADTAQKTGTQNDYSVIQCWGKSRGGQAVLLDQIRGKWEAPELLVQARAFWAKHKPGPAPLRAFKVEDKVSGTGLIQTLKREGIPMLAIQRDRDKVTRAYDAAPMIESGNVLLPRDAPWLSDLLAEATTFPNGAHDDQLDPLFDAVADMLQSSAAPSIRAL